MYGRNVTGSVRKCLSYTLHLWFLLGTARRTCARENWYLILHAILFTITIYLLTRSCYIVYHYHIFTHPFMLYCLPLPYIYSPVHAMLFTITIYLLTRSCYVVYHYHIFTHPFMLCCLPLPYIYSPVHAMLFTITIYLLTRSCYVVYHYHIFTHPFMLCCLPLPYIYSPVHAMLFTITIYLLTRSCYVVYHYHIFTHPFMLYCLPLPYIYSPIHAILFTITIYLLTRSCYIVYHYHIFTHPLLINACGWSKGLYIESSLWICCFCFPESCAGFVAILCCAAQALWCTTEVSSLAAVFLFVHCHYDHVYGHGEPWFSTRYGVKSTCLEIGPGMSSCVCFFEEQNTAKPFWQAALCINISKDPGQSCRTYFLKPQICAWHSSTSPSSLAFCWAENPEQTLITLL